MPANRSVLAPGELANLLRERPTTRLLDVRTPAEFETEHIAGAYNVPLDTLGEHGPEIRAHVADDVVLVCRSGQRARRAEDALAAAGMTNLHVLDGGMSAWVATGQPVQRGKPRLSLERQGRMVGGALAAIGGILALAVNPAFAVISALIGTGMFVAAITDTCAMGLLLARLPYNRPPGCDVPAMVRALTSGTAPRGAAAHGVADATCVRC